MRLLLVLWLPIVLQSNDWELKKDLDGIKVFTRSVTGEALKEFRAETIIENGDISSVIELLLDVNQYPNLYADCQSAKYLVCNDSLGYDIHYVVIDVPWPLEPRDAIYEQQITYNDKYTEATITLIPLPDYLPGNKSYRRIKKGKGHWQVSTVGTSVKVIYQFHPDPGGNIPAWLANTRVVDHPYKTMLNLKTLMRP